MPPLLVRLNLPGFRSPEPFRLASAPPNIAGLACAVLEEIGGFSKEELDGVRSSLDRVPLTLLGELCAGQLVELASDAQLGVFLATAESPRGEPAIIEVRPRDAPVDSFAEESNATSPAANPQPASPLQHSLGSSSEMQGLPQKLRISLLHASGLQGLHFTEGASAPRCSCEVLKLGQTASGCGRYTTAMALQALEPKWEESFEMDSWCVGDALQFCLLDGMQPGIRGQVVVLSQQFYPHGLEGDLPISGLPTATLRIRIMPLPLADAAAESMLSQRTVEVPAVSVQVPAGPPSPPATLSQTSPVASPLQVADWASASATRRDSATTPESVRKPVSLRSSSASRQPAPLQRRQQPPSMMAHEQHGPFNGASMSAWEGGSAASSSTAPPGGSNDKAAAQKSMPHRRTGSSSSAQLRPPSSERSEGHDSGSQMSDRPRREGSVYMRLYQEKDDRRRRRQDAEMRFHEAEENSIRESAQKALGRAPSPGRAHSPGRPRQSGTRANTPPPQTNKPPLPERPSSAGPRRRQPAESGGGGSRTAALLAPGHSPTPGQRPGQGHGQSPRKTGANSSFEDSSYRHGNGGVGSTADAAREAADDDQDSELQSLRSLCLSQQQRIEFLEHMHQQALVQLRSCREELSQAQQQRFQEADKVLRLEQLLSEMQVQRFEGDAQMQSRWQDWLQRSRSILEIT
eukprot:TRINITY_DN53643_c1_g1_i1.p1 TRINITY_DN53643_c1_g1~~TRINITY_DN53643_c1_g1_i1.p1  ORF type:complete len:689 (-),score=117.65 TRINITY_DN53643_c1_g1_i1:47-2113(-)